MHKDFQSAQELMAPYVEEIRDVCRDAWTQGLLSGCNGNASRRLPAPHEGIACLTCTGAAKGRLAPQNCCLVEIANAAPLYGGPASTESGMHLAIYRAKPQCGAILHTHPRRLLALSLRLEKEEEGLEEFLRLPLFEADVWRARLGFAPPFFVTDCFSSTKVFHDLQAGHCPSHFADS